MARVVHQRTSPPYLLIIMVFLFLIAATFFILSYMKADKLTKQLAGAEKTLGQLAGTQDLQDAKIEQMMNWYNDPPPGERSKTVVKQFRSQVNDLTRYVTGQEKDTTVAIAEIETALEKVGTRRGLVPEVLDLHSQRDQLQKQIKEKDDLLTSKQKEIEDKDQTIAAITKDHETRIASLQEQVRRLDNKLSEQHKTYLSDLDQARQGWNKERDSLNRNISGKARTIVDLQQSNGRLAATIVKLREEIRKVSQPKADPMQVGLKPDGKILQVAAQGGICYIDLGSKDRVTTGLSFSVYPPSGISKEGKGKGTIRVTNVGPNTSECHVLKQSSKDDPIIPDDLVANIAFDPTQTYTFVVEGDFDLYGTGRPSPQGAKVAEALILRSGGKITEEVGIDTDFIVVGEPPQRPAPPTEPASAQEWQVYREQLKVYERFNEVKALADGPHIPILNPNKFLAFIGYTPTKAER